MASHLSSMSNISHNHLTLCNHSSSPPVFSVTPYLYSLRPKIFNYPLKLDSRSCQQTKSFSSFSQVSLQDPIPQESQSPSPNHFVSQEESPSYPNRENAPSSKSYIWVNPRSSRATQLRQHSYDSRYALLKKLAASLNSCNPTEEDVIKVLTGVGENPLEQDAVVILNHMENPITAPLALKFFQQKLKPKREVILYNVTLKVFRKCRIFDRAEKLFEEMIVRGVKPDNVTFSTIISCARHCSLPNKAVEWFEKMPDFGCNPDNMTHSTVIDAYGRAGNIEKALSLYDRARTEKWRIDLVTFSTVIKIYGMSGNFNGAFNVYEEMKTLGVKPNLLIYNTLLDVIGRAKRPWQAKSVYKDMINSGISPNRSTYAALLRAYGRARHAQDALDVYKEMKSKDLELNVVLYNTLLAMCADMGYTDEAVEIFEDLKRSKTSKPDSWTFSSLITIYSCSGKVLEAESMLNEMLEAGFEPNIFVLTSLIQCYGKVNRTDDVVKTVNRLVELGIAPDDRFCGCLLNVMTQTSKEQLDKLIGCIEKANPKLGAVVKLLVAEETSNELFKQEATELFSSIDTVVKKGYCNCLIDLCVNLNLLDRSCELLDLGRTLDIYRGIQSKSPTQWSLHLKSLSLGAALTALHVWVSDLSKALENGEELPSLLGINTGHGKHKYSDKGLASALESRLRELNAPFHEVPDKVGWFLTTNVPAKSWLESRSSAQLVIA
ncbi:pentatricopeptide repeat-containing protein At4g16390, chloroplastic-like [Telopea speciosissima]|uniref:pentatricopeptide repeat-containing protein At4g16390, chloroplastic-like n=1 Tax=Telopea speciosissima TaxID=54955 RepID=UPI001CC820B0|nr:pentatricopeptide repeat-containing protein At4g16390, chloroplastic-like [Telopea speciosissima]